VKEKRVFYLTSNRTAIQIKASIPAASLGSLDTTLNELIALVASIGMSYSTLSIISDVSYLMNMFHTLHVLKMDVRSLEGNKTETKLMAATTNSPTRVAKLLQVKPISAVVVLRVNNLMLKSDSLTNLMSY